VACNKSSTAAPFRLGAAPPSFEKLEYHAKIAAGHLANLQAIKTALDPLYASFSDEQKKLTDGLRIGARNVTLMPRRRNRRATGAAIPSPLP
jgi:hypothetical protein